MSVHDHREPVNSGFVMPPRPGVSELQVLYLKNILENGGDPGTIVVVFLVAAPMRRYRPTHWEISREELLDDISKSALRKRMMLL
jgi:hypothetical protein